MTRKLHSAKIGNTFHPIWIQRGRVFHSFAVFLPESAFISNHTWLLRSLNGTQNKQICHHPLFYEFGYWDLVFISFMKWSKPLLLGKVHKKQFPIVALQQKDHLCKICAIFNRPPTNCASIHASVECLFQLVSLAFDAFTKVIRSISII